MTRMGRPPLADEGNDPLLEESSWRASSTIGDTSTCCSPASRNVQLPTNSPADRSQALPHTSSGRCTAGTDDRARPGRPPTGRRDVERHRRQRVRKRDPIPSLVGEQSLQHHQGVGESPPASCCTPRPASRRRDVRCGGARPRSPAADPDRGPRRRRCRGPGSMPAVEQTARRTAPVPIARAIAAPAPPRRDDATSRRVGAHRAVVEGGGFRPHADDHPPAGQPVDRRHRLGHGTGPRTTAAHTAAASVMVPDAPITEERAVGPSNTERRRPGDRSRPASANPLGSRAAQSVNWSSAYRWPPKSISGRCAPYSCPVLSTRDRLAASGRIERPPSSSNRRAPGSGAGRPRPGRPRRGPGTPWPR